jgi:hypothetical protein
VILVTSAAGLDPSAESLEPLRRQLDAAGAQVHVVAFPSQTALPSLPQLTAPGGAFLAVPETHEAGPVTQWRLTSALLQVLRHDARADAPNQVNHPHLHIFKSMQIPLASRLVFYWDDRSLIRSFVVITVRLHFL